MSDETKGLWLGLCAVTLFALTLPATRFVIDHLNPFFIGLGRAVVAAVVAGLLLWLNGSALPSFRQFRWLAVTSLGVVIGFPLFSAWAMQTVDASHGGIVLALLPLATAMVSVLISHERPSTGFWLAAVCGSLLVLVFALLKGQGDLQLGDLALLGAVISAAVGYATGGKLSREMDGWQVICWSLLIALPFILLPALLSAPENLLNLPSQIWIAFLYLALVSQLLGFFLWNRGLAIGGVARVSQTQLLQPFITLLASMLLLGEAIDLISMLFCCLVVISVAIARRMPIHSVARPRTD